MNTVIELLHEGARNFGNMKYLGGKIGEEWKTHSFREADQLSSALAAALIKLGFKNGDNISILSEGRSSWVISEFAILKAGCISVPLSTKLLEEEIIFRLEHSGARAFMVSENTFHRAVNALKKIKTKPVLIIISNRNSHLEELTAESAVNKPVYYEDLVAEGEKLLLENEYRDKLAKIEQGIKIDDTLSINYTSGTVGNPKGIMLSHGNCLHNAAHVLEIFYVQRGWKSLVILPLDHSFAHTIALYCFLIRGITMYFLDAQGGPVAALRNLPDNLKEVNPDFLLTVPALTGNFMKKMNQGVAEKGKLIKRLFDAGIKAGIARTGNGFHKPPLSVRLKNYLPWAFANALIFPKLRLIFGTDMKFCISGGALLEVKQQDYFNAIGVPVYQGYGLTENSPIICTNSAARHKFGTAGVIVPTTEVRIMKDENSECATGEIGQIVIRGGSVMKGYYKNQEATAKALIDGWLWTGDLGFKDSDGFLSVTGREKALLIASDGEKFSPEVIEEAIISTSKYIHQIMAYNEQCKFTSALVTLNGEQLRTDVEEQGLSINSTGDLDKIIIMIRDDLSAFTKHPDYSGIPPQWRPASFAIIPGVFDENNGLVNSTLKLVRYKVRDYYRPRLEEIYSGYADPLLPGNRKTLKSILAKQQ